MSIFSRLSDIINSNLTALLDKAEDPEKMVRLIIQEMEETLVEVRTTSARSIADRKELVRRRDWLRREAGEWERKAEVALRREREDLARAALLERNRVDEEIAATDSEVASLDESIAHLSEDIGKLQAKIKDARARQKSLVVRNRTATSRLGVRRQLSDASIDDAMDRFELYERRMDDLEGQVESHDLGSRTLADEIADLEADDRLDADLAALRQKLSGTEPASAAAEENPGAATERRSEDH
ncbi:MAG: phage shock protein PspA [Gammaproteobacteria bacterium]|nr:phage shock protein PspA [Gammaproteobacteria bacterium]